MVGWHHQPNGLEFEQTLGDREGQGSLACGSPWDYKESDMTQQLNNNDINSGDKSQLLEKTDTYEQTTVSHISVINCRN